MTDRVRSPFGAILREERRARGISQAELAQRIANRFATDPSVAELGVVSDRAIANLEAAKASASEFVRPRPETIRVIMLALGIDPASDRGQDMLRAATLTQRRERPTAPIVLDSRFKTPFVCGGRKEQWQALKQAWQVALTGQPQIRLIEGTAGLGKTRLVEELCQRVSQQGQQVILAAGECSSGSASVEPYLPWRRALSSALRIGSTESMISPLDQYFTDALFGSVSKLGGVVIDFNDFRHWLEFRASDRLGELERLRESLSPTNTTGRFDQTMELITLITKKIPLLIVLEDLHWADESSCSLLLHLQRQMRLQTNMPLLVVGTFRGSDLMLSGNRHPLLHVINEIQRQVEPVVLSLESTMESDRGRLFVEGLVNAFPMDDAERDHLTDALFARTNGHPLFTTELIQRLVDTKSLIEMPDNSWKLDRDTVDPGLPSRMRAIVDERIQRLSSDARTVIEVASVQGSPFSIDVIPIVSEISETHVDLLIDRELVEQHRILRPTDNPLEPEYEFDHEFMAETIYQSLSPHRRRTLHRRTAEAIIEINAPNALATAPKAAHHYEQANMLSEAAEQSLLASFWALAKLDHDLTLVWVDRSERLAKAANDDVRLWRARVRRAHVLRSMGALQEAQRVGLEGIEHASRLGEMTLEADAFEVVALVAYDRGSLDEATDAWMHSISLYEKTSRRDRVSANQSMLSHVACRMGRLDAAIRHARSAWAAAPDAPRDGLGAEALLAEGNALHELGRYQDAIDTFRRSLQAYLYNGEMRGIILCRMNIALCNTFLGNKELAAEEYAALQKELKRLQTPRLQAFVSLYQGKNFEASGDLESALECFQHALNTRLESGMLAMAGDDLAGVLRASIGLDRDVEANLEALQAWWRTNDPRALEDPLLAMLSLVRAYERLGEERLMHMTLDEGARMFLDRADVIQNPSIREMYLRGNKAGQTLLDLAREAGLVPLERKTT